MITDNNSIKPETMSYSAYCYYDNHAYMNHDMYYQQQQPSWVDECVKPPVVNRGGRKQVKVGTNRRNARERNRVRFINNCFDVLRDHIPQELVATAATTLSPQSAANRSNVNQKLSKVETLKLATLYIKQLTEVLNSDVEMKVDGSFYGSHASSSHSGCLSPSSPSSAFSSNSSSSSQYSISPRPPTSLAYDVSRLVHSNTPEFYSYNHF